MNVALNPVQRRAALKLPPYGKRFDVNATETVFIFAGGQLAWKRAEKEYQIGFRRALVLPDDCNSADYRWPVLGRDCIVIDYSNLVNEIALKNLAASLLGCHAVGVILIHAKTIKIYRYEQRG